MRDAEYKIYGSKSATRHENTEICKTYSDEEKQLIDVIDGLQTELKHMSDFIFDHPELGHEEVKAHKLLCDYLEQHGFLVNRVVSGLKTAFKAEHRVAGGGPKIGLLCEYDALEGLGHACGHHMQGPAIVGAAIALKRVLNKPATILVYGTPAEETSSGKLVMTNDGVFDDLDVAFMMHGSDSTTVDGKSLALHMMDFNFYGKAAHAAIAPEQGVSALDGVLSFFNGMEYLREHVCDDVKMHGIITDGGKAANIVPDFASAQWYIRANTRDRLNSVLERVKHVAEGAALQTGTKVEFVTKKAYDNKFNVPSLNTILLEYASKIGAPDISEPRKKTGSTDFSSVTYRVPGACIRVKYVDRGVSSHSQGWLDLGKTERAKDTILNGAKIIALTVNYIVNNPEQLTRIKDEFSNERRIATL